MSDDELKLNRRLFLQQTAVATATGAAACGIAMKTDALAQPQPLSADVLDPGSENIVIPYLYNEA
jgi:hypothetical protein